MVAYSRRKLLGRGRKAVYHCWARCVRRAFLWGQDQLTGQDYSHRRDWILTREEQLAGTVCDRGGVSCRAESTSASDTLHRRHQ